MKRKIRMSYKNWKIVLKEAYVGPSFIFKFVIYNVYDESGECDDSIRVSFHNGEITDVYSMDYGEYISDGQGDDYHDFIASHIDNISVLNALLDAHASRIDADGIIRIPDAA